MLSIIDKTYKNARIPPSKWQKVDLQLTPTQIKKAQQGLYGKPTEGKDYWETIFEEFKKKHNQRPGPIEDANKEKKRSLSTCSYPIQNASWIS